MQKGHEKNPISIIKVSLLSDDLCVGLYPSNTSKYRPLRYKSATAPQLERKESNKAKRHIDACLRPED